VSTDEAIEILRRVERILAGIQAEQKDVRADLRWQAESFAELRGKVSALPTIWQIVPAMLAINAGIMALGFALAKLVK
jgi:hypothetical protein